MVQLWWLAVGSRVVRWWRIYSTLVVRCISVWAKRGASRVVTEAATSSNGLSMLAATRCPWMNIRTVAPFASNPMSIFLAAAEVGLSIFVAWRGMVSSYTVA
jgi:hypothetical protein